MIFSPAINCRTLQESFCFIDMGVLRQLGEYLYLRKKDPNRPDSSWVKYMHGINRISILMFLFGLIILFYKLFIKKA